MKIDRRKIVFSGILLLVLILLVGYTTLVVKKEQQDELLKNPSLPAWKQTSDPFESKMEAVNALREERSTPNRPSPYPDHMIDEKGYFNPDYMEYEKNRIIDSIYARENFSSGRSTIQSLAHPTEELPAEVTPEEVLQDTTKNAQELGLDHQLFFAASPRVSYREFAMARIVGNHTLRKDSRIALQITKSNSEVENAPAPLSVLWGTVTFGSNRVFISITNLNNEAVALEAFDLQDGLRGIYMENSFWSAASTEVIKDVVEDLNIPGVPEVRGIKNVFRRRLQNIKVTVLDGHALQLKTKV